MPQVIGQTAEAQSRKGGGLQQRQWDEASFFAEIEATQDEATLRAARRIYQWTRERFPVLWFGKGAYEGSCFFYRLLAGTHHCPFGLRSSGRLELPFLYMDRHNQRPFDDANYRIELLRRLNRVPGINLPEDSIHRRPSFLFKTLDDEAAWEQFQAVIRWYLDEIQRAAQEETAP